MRDVHETRPLLCSPVHHQGLVLEWRGSDVRLSQVHPIVLGPAHCCNPEQDRIPRSQEQYLELFCPKQRVQNAVAEAVTTVSAGSVGRRLEC